jgi:O-antigen ligase
MGALSSAVTVLFVLAHMQDIAGWVAPVSLVLMFLVHARGIKKPARVPLEIRFLVILVVYMVAVTFINRSFTDLGIVEFTRGHGRLIYMCCFTLVVFITAGDRSNERLVYGAAMMGAFINSVLAAYSVYVQPLEIAGTKLSGGGLWYGLYGGHNPLAGGLGAVVILALVMVGSAGKKWRRNSRKKAFILCAISPTVIAFMGAQSRGYAIALGVTVSAGYGLLLARRYWTRRVGLSWVLVGLLIIGAGLGAGRLLEGRFEGGLLADPNVRVRLELWDRGRELFSLSPLTGLGLGTFSQVNVRAVEVIPGVVGVRTGGRYLEKKIEHSREGGLHAHNIIVQLGVEGGLIGLCLWMVVLVTSVRSSNRIIRYERATGAPRQFRLINAYLVLMLTCYLLVGGMVAGYTFTSPGTAWLLYYALARNSRHVVNTSGRLALSRRGSRSPTLAASRLRRSASP